MLLALLVIHGFGEPAERGHVHSHFSVHCFILDPALFPPPFLCATEQLNARWRTRQKSTTRAGLRVGGKVKRPLPNTHTMHPRARAPLLCAHTEARLSTFVSNDTRDAPDSKILRRLTNDHAWRSYYRWWGESLLHCRLAPCGTTNVACPSIGACARSADGQPIAGRRTSSLADQWTYCSGYTELVNVANCRCYRQSFRIGNGNASWVIAGMQPSGE